MNSLPRFFPRFRMASAAAFSAGLLSVTFSGESATLIRDSFDAYGAGPLSSPPTAGSPWIRHSGAGDNLLVQGGAVQLLQADVLGNKDDAHQLFAGGAKFKPDGDADNANNLIYASFGVIFTGLPTSAGGSYFAHLKSDSANEFYGRVWAGTEGADKIRLGISGESAGNGVDAARLAQDLDLNVAYTVVTRLNVDTGVATLWVNPTSESDPGATSTDTWSNAGEIESFALRQGTTTPAGGVAAGSGSLLLDNLVVATTFAEVVPEPNGLTVMGGAILAVLLWREKRQKA